MLRVKLIRELLADDGRIECVDVPVAGDVGGARGPLKNDASEFVYSELKCKFIFQKLRETRSVGQRELRCGNHPNP